jgi:hypothetical protein
LKHLRFSFAAPYVSTLIFCTKLFHPLWHTGDTQNNNNKDTAETDRVVVALQNQGISLSVARKIAHSYPADHIILKQEYLEFLLAKRPHEVKKPAAWLRKAIEDDYSAPDGFVSQEERQRQAAEEKRRNQAVLEAQEREYKRREADEKAHAAATAAKRRKLHAQYGTTAADIALWDAVLTDLSYGVGAIHALVANAEILQVTDDSVRLGIPHDFQFRQLQHPGFQTAIRRAFKQQTMRSLGLELVLIAAEKSDPGPHPTPAAEE